MLSIRAARFAALLAFGCNTQGSGGATLADAALDGPSMPDDRAGFCRIPETVELEGGFDGSATCGDVTESIIRETCTGGICHHAGQGPAGHLNLQSSCVADRLVGVTSSCNGRFLIDPAAPEKSFLLEKLEKDKPECGGESMPYANHLPPKELECMRAWVYAVARARR